MALCTPGGLWDAPERIRHRLDSVDFSGLVDRRRFLAISGSGLLALVSQYLNGAAGRGPFSLRVAEDTDSDPLVAQVEQNLPLLQQVDDEHGGARHLPYVGAQFRSVGLLLHEGGHGDAATVRLIRALDERASTPTPRGCAACSLPG
ncbi:hypothetical protein ACFVY0_43230 [Streptomyces sp. NPDC058286]|uniref:hypothetical protein n=1 Tax=Streptomyces sp. NPDC058286 TaxID=3346422 RepID=UPI0036E5C566